MKTGSSVKEDVTGTMRPQSTFQVQRLAKRMIRNTTWKIETQLNNFMQPHSLQPFYFIPISSCVIVVLQFSIFGFSIKFKPAEAECCIYKKCVNRLKSLAKELGTIAFILLALVTWRHDVLKWKAMPAEDQLETFCYFLVVLVTSPNTKAALAHFAILRVQSPTAVFGVNPKYRSLPGCGIPVFPCTASWMTPFAVVVHDDSVAL